MIVVAKVEPTQHLKYVTTREFEAKTTAKCFEFVENRVIQIFENQVKAFFSPEDFDQTHEILVPQSLQSYNTWDRLAFFFFVKVCFHDIIPARNYVSCKSHYSETDTFVLNYPFITMYNRLIQTFAMYKE